MIYERIFPTDRHGNPVGPSRDELVRCRDCVDMHKQPWNALTATGLWCSEHGIPVNADGYCAWGARADA